MLVAAIIAILFVLLAIVLAAREVRLDRARRRTRERAATLEGAGSHLSTRR